jgi:hypothetical protein
MGQRVMSFAAENQILVSRSFFEVASSISESYAGLFKYEGVRTDKHIREHTLYQLHPPDAARTTLAADTAAPPHTAPLTDPQIALVENQLAAVIGPIAPHLVKNAMQHSESPVDLRHALLAFIPAKPDQEKFLAACRDVFPLTPAGSAAPATEEPKAPLVPQAWDPVVLERARKELAHHIGPMAKMLVERAAAKTQTRTALYQLLAAEIHSPKDREVFLKQAGL